MKRLFLLVLFLLFISCDSNSGSGGGNQNNLTDIDGNTYSIVQIGNQFWMAENLKTTHYSNGDPIPSGYTDLEWVGLSTGAYAISSDLGTYGNFYNWYAVNDVRGVCPLGWHVPSDDEYKELEMTLGMSQSEEDLGHAWRGTNEGSKLAGNAILWDDALLEYDSEFSTSGFNALPAGYRNGYGYGNGFLTPTGSDALFWTATVYDVPNDLAWWRGINYNEISSLRSSYGLKHGFSVRCIEDY